jgi:hypothetical protein
MSVHSLIRRYARLLTYKYQRRTELSIIKRITLLNPEINPEKYEHSRLNKFHHKEPNQLSYA